MGTARLELRLDVDVQARYEKASELLGMKSPTAYESMILDKDVFDQLMKACEKSKAHN